MIFVLIHTDLQSGWVDATESQSQCADLRQSELTDFTEKCIGMGTYSEYLTLDFNFHPVWGYQTCWAEFKTHIIFFICHLRQWGNRFSVSLLFSEQLEKSVGMWSSVI